MGAMMSIFSLTVPFILGIALGQQFKEFPNDTKTPDNSETINEVKPEEEKPLPALIAVRTSIIFL